MKRKILKAIADFAEKKNKRWFLNGLIVDFLNGSIYAGNGIAMVKADFTELRQDGPIVFWSINEVLDKIKHGTDDIEISPRYIVYEEKKEAIELAQRYENLIPPNNKLGILPWCDPENLMKVEKLSQSLNVGYEIFLPENLHGLVKFNLFAPAHDGNVIAVVMGNHSKNEMLNWKKV